MVSQDVDESLSKRFVKWLIISVISIVAVVVIIFFKKQNPSNLLISAFVLILLLTLITILMAVFNLVIWLKIKSAIRTYHQGNYERAKDIAISAYKLSNYKEINELIDYIDEQIIDEKISQQERLEQESFSSDYLQEIAELIEDIDTRIIRQNKIKQEISAKLQELKQQNTADSADKDQYQELIAKYEQWLNFTDYKLQVYNNIKQRLLELQEQLAHRDKILREQEDLLDLQEKILSEGYTTEEDEQQVEFSPQLRNTKVFLEYVKEFLASTVSVENPDEFTRIYKEFAERSQELNISV